jgi:hypothetical protein
MARKPPLKILKRKRPPAPPIKKVARKKAPARKKVVARAKAPAKKRKAAPARPAPRKVAKKKVAPARKRAPAAPPKSARKKLVALARARARAVRVAHAVAKTKKVARAKAKARKPAPPPPRSRKKVAAAAPKKRVGPTKKHAALTKKAKKPAPPTKKTARKKVAGSKSAPRPQTKRWVQMAADRKRPQLARVPKDRVFYVSPTTGEELAKPRKGQKVLIAHTNIRGETSILNKDPQTPDRRLLGWLRTNIAKDPGRVVLFVQKAREVVRPPKAYKPKKMEKIVRGVLYRRKPRESEWYAVHTTKLATPSTANKQQAVIYQRGHARPIEGGAARHSRQEIEAYREPKLVRPGRIINIPVSGPTIWDTMKPLLVDKALKRLKPWEELYYEYVIIYRDPRTGEKVTVPGRGKYLPEGHSTFVVKKKHADGWEVGLTVGRKKIERAAWPIASQISRSIRLALAESGVRFSSAYSLTKAKESIEKRLDERITRGDTRGAAHLERALAHVDFLRPVMHGSRVLSGSPMEKLIPLRPERSDGRVYKDVPGALRVMLRITVSEGTPRSDDEARAWQDAKKKARKAQKARRTK